MSKAQRKRDAIKAWWDRSPWPCVLLAVDPGRNAGAAVMACHKHGIDLKWHGPIDIYTREVEAVFSIAHGLAVDFGYQILMAVEDWGKGGPMGLSHWVGLGEARGAWTREFRIQQSDDHHYRRDGIVKINMRTWRSRIIQEKLPKLDTREQRQEQLKVAAHRAAQNYFIGQMIDIDPDACEAVCVGLYAARSDELAKKLTKTHLKNYGLTFESLESSINPKPKKKK